MDRDTSLMVIPAPGIARKRGQVTLRTCSFFVLIWRSATGSTPVQVVASAVT